MGVVNLGWEGGKRKRKYVYGWTYAEVREDVTRLLHDVDTGITVPTDRQTVEQFLNRWLSDVVDGSRRASTTKNYRQNMRLHVIPIIGKRQLSKITGQDIQAMLRDRERAGLAPQTRNHVLTQLRMALDQAVRWRLIPFNPANDVTPPKIEAFEGVVLDHDHARVFIETARGDRLEGLWVLAISQGMRKGEICGLRWADVNLEKGVLRISRSLQRVDGKLTLVELKTPRSRRTLQLPAICVTALKTHKKTQLDERLLAGPRWQDNGLVFTSTIGTPIDGAHLSIFLNKLLAKAGLPRMRFHDLRHSAATLMLAEGVSPRVIADILGHSSITTTLTTYAHVLPTLNQDAADRMDAIFSAPETRDKQAS